ncbi:bifunctional hydroxymethylpyrimidine kinase/phosphomethylpyrimidine kinase [Campylobacter sp. VicNov18]|uniref:bifunctional hydroxymethylpyrimidine kinase/phosphomethylpyrimidine kinase n=1 Tax=Campylobacter bilis TaxID=2691918 RepID=UPI00130DDADA|nr:bifunctional hydroxymethylpyrimidine kinase/phosphomethylpyrimidine kinase [Campylobacter bilis]MPV63673.1 bifunctional hydroxymethylpyrimidine kinase/phosphomethylpyrimidine kinase [Campylobacter hepaticus]MBM0637174.1 bifunctional hydroxymethylpyrimidine kinase/phosphomethylpyrimidine kinase [Campylobacter bilis]MCC8277890.1 bifunctional hydroxymethylpyrimidine kinase/phosphomethylpyrimidine kinase [Campylobacter bilis]MCC8298821.1 bifunctional hydroxymethylpyrimidine kinase/phosphomethylp
MKAKGSDLIPILTIAGSDCSGGAGIQADLKTFSAHRLFGMSVILSVVAENTARVISVHEMPVKSVDDQMLAVFEDIVPKATKIGMIGSCDLITCIAYNLEKFKPQNVVIDPVMFAKNGYALMPEENCGFFKKNIIKFADVLTPNIPEAEFLCEFKISNEEEMIKAAKHLCSLGAKAVLLKGGHSKDNANDVLFDGCNIHILKAERIKTKNTHGTGCTLSSAIASNLAKGKDLLNAVSEAKKYVNNAIYYSLNLGKGYGPINHFEFVNEK